MSLSKKTVVVGGSVVFAGIGLAIALPLVLLSPEGGPVSTLINRGQPVITSASGATKPDQDYNATAYVVSSAHDKVTLLSASLVPLHGEPAGKLVHAGVYLDHSYDAGQASRFWPPPGDHVRPLRGALIGHGQTGILFAMTGPASGHGYTMSAGVKIIYAWHGQRYSVIAWSASVACGDKLSFNRCGQLFSKAQAVVIKQAG
jgi:hypothetical protein